MSAQQRASDRHRSFRIPGSSTQARPAVAVRAIAVAAAAVVAGLAAPASAVDKFWDVASGGWDVSGNWSPAGVPTGADKAFINNGGTAEVTTAQSVNAVRVGSGTGNSGTLSLSGSGSLNSATNFYIAGDDDGAGGFLGGSGSLNISDSAVLSSNAGAHIAVGYSGPANFSMTGGSINSGGGVLFGWRDGSTLTGTLSGGSITSSSHIWMAEGPTSSANLTMTGGSLNTAANGFLIVANNPTGGSATLDMQSGTASAFWVFAAHQGQGTIKLSGDASVTAGTAAAPLNDALTIAQHPTAVGTLEQTGGTMKVWGQVVMSNTVGSNSLYDLSGGTLNAFNDNATANQDVSVRVGQHGTGTFKVSGTGVANIGRHMIVGGNGSTNGVGTLDVSGGELNLGMGAANAGQGILGIGANGVGTSTVSGGEINTAFLWTGYVANAVSHAQSTQTGGTINVAADMDIGRASAQNNSYEISAGAINVGDELTVARLSARTAAPTDPWAGTVSKGTLTIGGTAAVAVTGQLSNSTGFTPTAGANVDIAQPGGVGVIQMNGGTLTAGSFLNGAAANADPSHAGSGASANYNQTGGTASVGAITGTGNIAVSGGSLTASSIQQPSVAVSGTGVVQVAAGGTTSNLGTLAISGTGKLDLSDNTLVTTATPAANIRQYLKTGRNGGNWQGNGLTSSSAAATPITRALGYADNGGTVTVKYTVAGDANLDGSTDGSDLNIWNDNKFQGNKVWSQADFNYDDATDGSDLNIWNDNKFTMITGASAASVATNASGHIADMIYDPSSGQLKLVVHDVGVVQAAILVETAEGNVIAGHPGNLPNHPFGFQSWSYRYFNGKMQFTDDALNLGGGASVGTGEYVIGTLLTGLGLSDFGVVEYGSNLGTQFTTVSLIPEPATLGLIGLMGLGLMRRARRSA